MKRIQNITLLIVTASVVLLTVACSRRPSNYIGRVNDRYVTFEEYMNTRRSLYESYILETGITPDTQARKEIDDRAFRSIVERIIFQELLREYRITVTRREVIEHLTDNIPDIIINSRQFNDDGEFDHQSYRSSLTDNTPFDLSWMVGYYYEIQLPYEKLKEKIISGFEIDQRELRNEFIIANSSAEASIIHFDPDHFEDILIHDSEIRSYYNENRIDFLQEPYAVLQYVIFPLKPSSADSLRTKTVIDSIYTELEEMTPFSLLAGEVSDSQTAVNRGEMPFLELSSFPARIRSDLEQLKVDEYTKPFSVQDGWVIYKLIARTRNLIKLREIFISHRPSEQTRDQLYRNIVNIRELATEIGLERTSYEYDLEIHTSEKITPDEPFLPILGKSDRIIDRAVNADPGAIFEPVFHEQLQAYVLINVIDNQGLEYLSLHEVSDDIRKLLFRKRQQEAARERAENYHRRTRYNRIIEEAENEGFQVYHFDAFYIGTDFQLIDPSLLARNMFISGKDRYIAEPVSSETGTFIGVVHKLQKADWRDVTPVVKDGLRERIIRERGDEMFDEWLQKRFDNAKVRDWRHRID